MSVHYEDDSDWDTLAVSREDIEASQDVEQMAEWHRSMSEAADDIRAQLDAADYAKSTDEDWRGRATTALSFHLMGLRRVAKRLATFGIDVNPPKTNVEHLTTRLQSEQEQRNKLKQRLFVAGLMADAVKAEIGAAAYERLQIQVMAALDAENAVVPVAERAA